MEKLTLKGKDYYFSKMAFDHLDDFTEWGKTQLPNAIDEVREKLADFPPDQQKMLLEAAVANVSKVISQADDRIHHLMMTPEGRVMMLSLMLRDRHKELTDKERLAIVRGMYDEHGGPVLLEMLHRLVPKTKPGAKLTTSKKNSHSVTLSENSTQQLSLTGIQ